MRVQWNFLINCLCSVAIAPLYTIALSMQMSVMSNITIYGDVKPQDINKGLLSDKIGLGKLVNRKAIATSEKQMAIFEEGKGLAPKLPEARSDLIAASGQVGHNKPFRAPIYRTYWECI